MAQFDGNAHWAEPSSLFAHRARPTPLKCKNEYLMLPLGEGNCSPGSFLPPSFPPSLPSSIVCWIDHSLVIHRWLRCWRRIIITCLSFLSLHKNRWYFILVGQSDVHYVIIHPILNISSHISYEACCQEWSSLKMLWEKSYIRAQFWNMHHIQDYPPSRVSAAVLCWFGNRACA